MILLHRFHPRHRGLIIIARDICVFVRTFVRYARLLLLLLLLQVIIGRVVVRGGGFVFSRGILWWEARLFQGGLHVVGERAPSGTARRSREKNWVFSTKSDEFLKFFIIISFFSRGFLKCF